MLEMPGQQPIILIVGDEVTNLTSQKDHRLLTSSSTWFVSWSAKLRIAARGINLLTASKLPCKISPAGEALVMVIDDLTISYLPIT